MYTKLDFKIYLYSPYQGGDNAYVFDPSSYKDFWTPEEMEIGGRKATGDPFAGGESELSPEALAEAAKAEAEAMAGVSSEES